MRPPRRMTEQWAADNPKQAVAALVFWGILVGITIWIVVTD